MGRVAVLLGQLALVSAYDLPKVGKNPLATGGGGSCTYSYTAHDKVPVVMSATCDISPSDLNTGTEPNKTTEAYARNLGKHDGCDNDDAGHIIANRLGGQAVRSRSTSGSPPPTNSSRPRSRSRRCCGWSSRGNSSTPRSRFTDDLGEAY